MPRDALQQFSETEKWREENAIAQLYENIDIKDYEETRRLVSTLCGYLDIQRSSILTIRDDSTHNGPVEEVCLLQSPRASETVELYSNL